MAFFLKPIIQADVVFCCFRPLVPVLHNPLFQPVVHYFFPLFLLEAIADISFFDISERPLLLPFMVLGAAFFMAVVSYSVIR